MSRINPNGNASNPAVKYFDWSAEQGCLRYYDKEKQENVCVDIPFPFLILDEVSQVGGGTKINGKYEGYWSNAVKNLNTQIITVKSRAGIVAQGLYADLKERKGLHYVKGLYVAFYDENKQLQIGYIKFKGSALGTWFEFTKTHRNLYTGAFVIKGRELQNGEKGDYYTPVFAFKSEVKEETDTTAGELQKELQEYFKTYFAAAADSDDVQPTHSGYEAPEGAFAAKRENALAASASAPVGFDPSSGPDDYDDEIPF